MGKSDNPRDLLNELEHLQRVLDDTSKTDQQTESSDSHDFDPLADIPILDDLFSESADDPDQILSLDIDAPATELAPFESPTEDMRLDSESGLNSNNSNLDIEQPPLLKAVDVKPEDLPPVEGTKSQTNILDGENPFLPKSMLSRLAEERQAAEHSAVEAQRSIQKMMEARIHDLDDLEAEDQHDDVLKDLFGSNPSTTATDANSAANVRDLLNEITMNELTVVAPANNIASNNAASNEANVHSIHPVDDEEPTESLTSEQKQQLIDELVAEMLPEIEQKLRERLAQQLQS